MPARLDRSPKNVELHDSIAVPHVTASLQHELDESRSGFLVEPAHRTEVSKDMRTGMHIDVHMDVYMH